MFQFERALDFLGGVAVAIAGATILFIPQGTDLHWSLNLAIGAASGGAISFGTTLAAHAVNKESE